MNPEVRAGELGSVFQAVRDRLREGLPEILACREDRTLKADGSYVTRGDMLAQRIILGELKRWNPEACVVSEELPLEEQDATRGWTVVLDPLDGTENFTSGFPEWGISLSCYHRGAHRASMIGCPEMGLWLATGDRIPRFQSRIRGLSSSLSREDLIAATEGFEYRVTGCCVYNMLNVIRGSFVSFENPRGARAWDILAGINLAREHGLSVEIEGKAYAGEYLKAGGKYRFKVQNR